MFCKDAILQKRKPEYILPDVYSGFFYIMIPGQDSESALHEIILPWYHSWGVPPISYDRKVGYSLFIMTQIVRIV